jgi:DNA-binding beta-propeller fold protein YncE
MLEHIGYVDLPPHAREGGFDHAAVHPVSRRVYVAHTANDAVDVIDGAAGRFVETIAGLPGVAGALVDETRDLVFTSNRAENTVGVLAPARPADVVKVPVGVRPNGLAYDPARHRLLVAHVGDPTIPDSFTVSIVDVGARARGADLPVPGRTRWAVYDPGADAFHVNVMDPPLVVTIGAREPFATRGMVEMPSAGPHGLDLDAARRRLYCACDGGRLIEVDADRGEVLRGADLHGVPDVIFFNPALERLYVAIGDPGAIEVFETRTLRRVQTLTTEKGAHTLAFDAGANLVYAFLPASHRAGVYVDRF